MNSFQKVLNKFYSLSKNTQVAIISLIGLTLITGVTYQLGQHKYINKSQAATSWQLLGVHPTANTQTTATGKTLNTMTVHNGRLYLGYGDYHSNTGPIYISYYDPQQNTFILSHILQTESIETLNIINNKLYAVVSDRRGSPISYASGEPWVEKTFTGADSEHNFDIKSLTGTDIWLSTTYASCRIWRSTDQEASWTNSYSISYTTGKLTGTTAARCSFLGVYNGKMYFQPHDSNASQTYAHSSSFYYDGSKWSTGPDLLPNKTRDRGWKANTFAGKMVYKSDPSTNADFYVFNGTTVSKPLGKLIADYFIDGNTLYIVASDLSIYSTTNLLDWTQVATAPLNASSIGVLNGKIYIGTKNSELYTLSSTDTTPIPSPTTPLLSPTLPAEPSPTTTFPTATPIPSSTLAPTTSTVDNTNPTVTITSPLNGTSVRIKTNVNITANAADNIAVDRVVFTVGGNTSTDYTAPYSYNWSIPGAANKSYVVSATAYDTRGNSSVSQITVRSIR